MKTTNGPADTTESSNNKEERNYKNKYFTHLVRWKDDTFDVRFEKNLDY